ncbi:MAG TPA: histidine phosphatase family protein [Gemmatimonadales bacterium]|nr:histidine phosphatase family protein [Gemmatimonadales bacterium]
MTTFLLIRHALADPVGRLIAGRQPGVHLNDAGRQQASRLAERLDRVLLEAIYSSPLERARETAEPIAGSKRLQVQTVEAWNEIDFGEWTGRALSDLDPLPEWKRFNSSRSSCTIPGGENMADVLGRVLRDLDRLRCLHPAQGSCVGIVSHGDVLRTLVAHVLGIPLDFFQRLEISPASVTILEISGQAPRVLLLNSTDGWPGAIGRPG